MKNLILLTHRRLGRWLARGLRAGRRTIQRVSGESHHVLAAHGYVGELAR